MDRIDDTLESGQDDALIRSVLASIPESPMPDLSQSVLSRIGESEQPGARGTRSVLQWFWNPRPVAFRPAYGLAAALLVFALLTRESQVPAVPPAAADTSNQVFIQFRLDAPAAQRVSLVGDFTEWKPEYQLVENQPGVWTIVVPLQPGMHEYAFIIDGERWVSDPYAPAVGDGFGGVNSRMAVMTPDVETL